MWVSVRAAACVANTSVPCSPFMQCDYSNKHLCSRFPSVCLFVTPSPPSPPFSACHLCTHGAHAPRLIAWAIIGRYQHKILISDTSSPRHTSQYGHSTASSAASYAWHGGGMRLQRGRRRDSADYQQRATCASTWAPEGCQQWGRRGCCPWGCE